MISPWVAFVTLQAHQRSTGNIKKDWGLVEAVGTQRDNVVSFRSKQETPQQPPEHRYVISLIRPIINECCLGGLSLAKFYEFIRRVNDLRESYQGAFAILGEPLNSVTTRYWNKVRPHPGDLDLSNSDDMALAQGLATEAERSGKELQNSAQPPFKLAQQMQADIQNALTQSPGFNPSPMM